jgi:hypothetical protein
LKIFDVSLDAFIEEPMAIDCDMQFALAQSDQYINLCNHKVRLQQQDECIIKPNKWAVMRSVTAEGKAKCITITIKEGTKIRGIMEKYIKDAGPEGLMVEKTRGVPKGKNSKWL